MEYQITDFTGSLEPYVYQYDAFTSNELDILQNQTRTAEEPSWIGSDNGVINTDVRRSKLKWVHCSNETRWVFEKLSYHISNLNSMFYNFNLTGFGEPLQLTNYDNTDSGMYSWHQDFGGTISRKLSLVLQLSDPADYEGGCLELNPGGHEPIRIEKRRGLLVAFPSWQVHQVTPVTQGTRQSLVAWVTGPRFR